MLLKFAPQHTAVAGKKTKTLAKYKVKVAEHFVDDNRDLLQWSLGQLDQLSRQQSGPRHKGTPPQQSSPATSPAISARAVDLPALRQSFAFSGACRARWCIAPQEVS